MKKLVTPTTIAFSGIILLAAILRLWNVGGLFSFGIDEEYQSHLAWSQVKHFHKIWIGVSASNIGYYLGPGFTYLNALLFKISHGDPLILGYFSSLLGVLTTASILFITKKLYGTKAAIIAGLIYASSALMVFYDRRFWNPTPIPILSIWMFYSLMKAKENARWLMLSALLMGMSYHFHITFWMYYPFFYYTLFTLRKKIDWQTWVAMPLVFLLITFPLLVFDFVHNFDNLLMPLHFLQSKSSTHSLFNISEHINNVVSTLGRIWYLPFHAFIFNESVPSPLPMTDGTIIFSILSLSILVWAFVTAKDFKLRFLWIVSIVFISFFILYPGSVSEYYLLAFFPLFIVLSAVFFKQFSLQVLYPFAMILIILNACAVFTASQKDGLTAKKKLIQSTAKYIGDREYYLEMRGSYKSLWGWRYLFKTYGKTPAQSSIDGTFDWMYKDERSSEKPKLTVVVSDEEFNEPFIVKKFTEGNYRTYIIDP